MAEESKESTLTIRVTSLVKAKAMRRVLQEGANSVTQHRRRTSFVTCAAVLVTLFVFDLAGRYAWSESLFDESVRAQMFKHSDGLIAHIKTKYNNIFILKHKQFLFLRQPGRSRRHDGPIYTDSVGGPRLPGNNSPYSDGWAGCRFNTDVYRTRHTGGAN